MNAGKDFTGTNKDDLFIADNSVAGTVNASAVDTLNGGKGVDTFKLYDNTGAGATTTTSLPTLKNIENVVIYDNKAAAGAVNLEKWDTVETLFLVREVNAHTYTLGEKVTTVNVEDVAANTPTLKFNDAVAAATIGVNKVGTVGAAGVAATVTVDSATTAALKTLTINASGKASNVILDQNTTDTIETLNITGRADLTLAYAAPATASKIATIDGSKAQGKLDLSLANTDAATLKTVKTGTGDDTVTLNGLNVASGTTINLGAGNDKLVQGTAGTIAAGSIIDGGAGIDSLDSALVNFGNAGVFANFETLSLTTVIGSAPAALDLDLLTKSTITSIAKDSNAVHFVKNVQKSQSLTINTNATAATTLLFKDATGTADAYTINFAKDAAAVALGTTVAAGTVTIDGIETVTVNSTGKTTTTGNSITLNDNAAKSLVITGDKDLTVAFGTFGATSANATDGLGVSTIDASASTAGINIAALEFVKMGAAWSGLTIKGGAGADTIITGNTTAKALTIDSGAGNDTIDLSGILVGNALTKADIKVNAGAGDDDITVSIKGGTFTLGAGKDKIDVSAAFANGTTVATGAITTTITDIEKGDVIKGLNAAAGTLFAKANIDPANSLDAALIEAAKGVSNVTWFQYGSKTYIVNNDANAAFATTDIVVELNGTVNLGNSSLAGGELTIG